LSSKHQKTFDGIGVVHVIVQADDVMMMIIMMMVVLVVMVFSYFKFWFSVPPRLRA
jgi:hypothetical protein